MVNKCSILDFALCFLPFDYSDIINAIPKMEYICVDVANGYSENFVEFVRLVRREFPEKTIFVSKSDSNMVR